MAKQIQYSPELLKDFDKLINDFVMFMTMNLIHADKGLDPECQKHVSQLISYSVDSSRHIVGFFEQPLHAHEAKNREKFEKNFQNILKFMYEYLIYAEPILKKCKPDLYKGRFGQVNKHYLNFYAKYFG